MCKVFKICQALSSSHLFSPSFISSLSRPLFETMHCQPSSCSEARFFQARFFVPNKLRAFTPNKIKLPYNYLKIHASEKIKLPCLLGQYLPGTTDCRHCIIAGFKARGFVERDDLGPLRRVVTRALGLASCS